MFAVGVDGLFNYKFEKDMLWRVIEVCVKFGKVNDIVMIYIILDIPKMMMMDKEILANANLFKVINNVDETNLKPHYHYSVHVW